MSQVRRGLPGFQPLRAPWLAHRGCGAWFLSREPRNAKPRHHVWNWEVGEQYPPCPSGWTSPQRPQLPQWAAERLLAPSQPSARLTVLLADWLRARLLGQGWAWGTGTRLCPGPARQPREGWAVLGPRIGHDAHGWKQVSFSLLPLRAPGSLLGQSVWGPDEGSSVNGSSCQVSG